MARDPAKVEQLRQLGRQLVELGLTWGNGGNISVRTGTNSFLITASGTSLGSLEPGDFAECDLAGRPLAGEEKRPSKEAGMHAAIYKQRPDINAVIHSHPFYGLIMACCREEIPQNWFIENMYYLERTARVDYYHPGSKELAESVGAKAREANLLILNNHGIIAYDHSPQEALMTLQTFELVSRMYVACKGANLAVAGLPEEQVREFLEESGYKPRRDWSAL